MRRVPPIKKLKKICHRGIKRDIFLRIIYRNISIHITRVLLFTSITANKVTILSILFSVLAGVFLSVGELWSFIFGSIFLIFYDILDDVDGEIARYRKVMTFRGKYLELLAHRITGISIDIGLILGVYRILQNNIVLIFGFAMFLFGVLIKYAVSTNVEVCFLSKEKTISLRKKPSKGILPKLNMLVFSYFYFPYWILLGAILDKIVPVAPFGSFLMLFIVFHAFVRGFKFFALNVYFLGKFFK